MKLPLTESVTVHVVHVSLIRESNATCLELPPGGRGCGIKIEPSRAKYSWRQSFTCQTHSKKQSLLGKWCNFWLTEMKWSTSRCTTGIIHHRMADAIGIFHLQAPGIFRQRRNKGGTDIIEFISNFSLHLELSESCFTPRVPTFLVILVLVREFLLIAKVV